MTNIWRARQRLRKWREDVKQIGKFLLNFGDEFFMAVGELMRI